jgi:hypothetical protein
MNDARMKVSAGLVFLLISGAIGTAQTRSSPPLPAGVSPMSRFQLPRSPIEAALRPVELRRSADGFASAQPCRGLFVTSSASRFPSQKLDENILLRRQYAPVLLPIVDDLEQADVYAQVSPANDRRAVEIRVTNRRTEATTWQSIADDEQIDDVVNALLERAVKVCPGGLAPLAAPTRHALKTPHAVAQPSAAQVAAAWRDMLAVRAELNRDAPRPRVTFKRDNEVISAVDRDGFVLFSFTPAQLVDAQADSDWQTILPELPMANMDNVGNAGEAAGVAAVLCLGWDVAASGVNLIRTQHHFVTVTWLGDGERRGAIFNLHRGDAKRLVRALNTLRDATATKPEAVRASR